MKMRIRVRWLATLVMMTGLLLAVSGRAFGQDSPQGADAEEEVLRLLDQAQKLKERGDYNEAVPLVERALSVARKSLGQEHLGTAMSLNRLASLYQARGDYARAEPLFRQSLQIYEKGLGPEDMAVAQSLSNLALLYADKGEYDRAEPLYQRAIRIHEKLLGPEHTEVVSLMNNLGELYRLMGSYESAEQLLQKAVAISEKALGPEHPQVGIYLNNLATIYVEKGDYVRPEPLYQRAVKIYEKSLGAEHSNVATLKNNLGELYTKRGDYASASLFSQQALTVLEKRLGPEHPGLVPAIHNLAAIHVATGQHERAEPLYLRALAIREKALGAEHPDVAKSLNNLAITYSIKGDYMRAEPLYQRALAANEKVLGSNHPAVALALNNLATVYRAKKDYDGAEQLFKRALAIAEKVSGPEHPDTAMYLQNMAALYQLKGQMSQAIPLLVRSNDIRERNLSLILAAGSEAQKLSYMATLSDETDATITFHTRSAPDDPQAARLALLTVLRRKGRVLDVIAEQMGALGQRLNTQDRALLEKLRATRSQLSTLVLKGHGESDPARHQDIMVKLLIEAELLEREISSRSAEYRARSQPVTLERVQEAIPAGAALVEIFSYRPFSAQAKAGERFGLERYVAYVLRREGAPAWVDVGEGAAINGDVARLRSALANPRSLGVKQLARALDEKVMRPVRKLLGDTRMVFLSPDGALNLIPFGALVDEQDRYFVESYSLTYLTSGRDLLKLQVKAQSKQPPVAVGNPLFEQAAVASGQNSDAGRSTSGRRSADISQVKFSPLPGTAEEVQSLSATLPGIQVKTGAQATEAALKRVSGPSILHVATHGFFLADQPQPQESQTRGLALSVAGEGPSLREAVLGESPLLRSGIALAGANQYQGGAGEDGILTALEAAGLDLWGTKLVVLSACETGVGEVKNGDGVYGLRRALVLAGSESQVMSLWQVSDAATRDLMVEYYKRLQAGEGRTEALRQVQLGMLRGRERDHPFYWASFIQSGDWKTLEGKEQSAK